MNVCIGVQMSYCYGGYITHTHTLEICFITLCLIEIIILYSIWKVDQISSKIHIRTTILSYHMKCVRLICIYHSCFHDLLLFYFCLLSDLPFFFPLVSLSFFRLPFSSFFLFFSFITFPLFFFFSHTLINSHLIFLGGKEPDSLVSPKNRETLSVRNILRESKKIRKNIERKIVCLVIYIVNLQWPPQCKLQVRFLGA